MRFLTILVNLIIGIFCAAVTIFISSKLLNLIEKSIDISDEWLLIFRCVWGGIWIILFIWLIIFKYNQKLFFKLQYGEIKGVHILNVRKEEFLQIILQKKSFEFRLADIKRRRMKVGDILVFNNIDNLEKYVNTEIKALYFADNFSEFMLKIPLNDELKTNLGLLNNQYPLERQKKRRVIAINFEVI
jgi:ASC-1-like (ASCH) protein